MKLRAFTLAEILITLGIIGVVAAITMPVVIKNYQKSVIENQLKKSYSIINQAIKLSEIDNGDVLFWTFPSENTVEENHEFLKKYFLPYLKVIKDCAGDSGCWTDKEYRLNGNEITSITNSANEYNVVKFVISDGTNIAYFTEDNGKGRFYFDVNGMRKPNTRGKDIFEFIFEQNKNNSENKNFYPPVGKCSKEKNSYTFSCAKVLMDNGWRFPKDYPW